MFSRLRLCLVIVSVLSIFAGQCSAPTPPAPQPTPPAPPSPQPEDDAKISLKVSKLSVPDTPIGPSGDASDIAIAGSSIFVLIEGTLFRSDDNAKTFVKVGKTSQPSTQLRVAINGPQTWVGVYRSQHEIAFSRALGLSSDGGKTFVQFDNTRGLDFDVHGVAFGQNHIYVATKKGLKRRSYNADLTQEDFVAIPNPSSTGEINDLNNQPIHAVHVDGAEIYAMGNRANGDLTAFVSVDNGATFIEKVLAEKVSGGGEIATSTKYAWFAHGGDTIARYDKTTLSNPVGVFGGGAAPDWHHIKAAGNTVVAQSSGNIINPPPSTTGRLLITVDDGNNYIFQGDLDKEAAPSALSILPGFGVTATKIYLRPNHGWLFEADIPAPGATEVDFSRSEGYADLATKFATTFNGLHVDQTGIFGATNDGIFLWRSGQTNPIRLLKGQSVYALSTRTDGLFVSYVKSGFAIGTNSAFQLKSDDSLIGLSETRYPGAWMTKTQIIADNLFFLTSKNGLGVSPIQPDNKIGASQQVAIKEGILDIQGVGGTLFVATDTGLFSVDNSNPTTPIGPKLIDSANPSAAVNFMTKVFAVNDKLVFVAAKEGVELYRSEDAGNSFTQPTGISVPSDYKISSIGGNNKVIYVVLKKWAGVFGIDSPSHLYRSTDQGKTFEIEKIEGLADNEHKFDLVQVYNDKVYLAGNGYVAVQQ